MFFRVSVSIRSIGLLLILSMLGGFPGTSTGAAQETEDLPAVLITGTSSGIGLRITEVLSENGFFVYAGAREAQDLARLDAMPNVKAVRLDVTIQSEIDAAVALVEAEGRGLFGLINNAGVAVLGPLVEMPEADMVFQLDTNLFGPYRVTAAFSDLIIESQGRIATVGSIAGIVTGPFGGAYSMSKHGVEAYVDALAAELEPLRVKVAVIEPGNYKSQIYASMVKRMDETGYSAEGSRWGSMRDLISGPLDRSQYKEPDEVAQAALHFLTSDSPKRRYMVVPNQSEAELTIRQALRKVAQLNEGQPYAYGRDELVEMLDEILAEVALASSPPAETGLSIGLHQAVVEGNLEAVRAHIEVGSDLNVKEPSGGSSPLLSAAIFGQTDIALALIDAGADVNQQNNEGSTPLMSAAFMCRTEIVEALLAAGADRNLANNAGSTPLDVVTIPFEDARGIYDYLGAVLGPYGLKLDYERIEATRPVIADMLRE